MQTLRQLSRRPDDTKTPAPAEPERAQKATMSQRCEIFGITSVLNNCSDRMASENDIEPKNK